MSYAVIRADGTFTIDPRPVTLPLINEVVGPEGWARITLDRSLGMAGWCNDRAYAVFADQRNIPGGAILVSLGASALPYCGTVVLSGYNHASDWGGPEDLTDGQRRGVEAIHADVSIVLAGGRVDRPAVSPDWCDAINEYADLAGAAELPPMMAWPVR